MMRRLGWALMALLLAGPGAALAGPDDTSPSPYDEGHHCPHGIYSILHYWFPEYYEARSLLHRYDLDEFAPGPNPPVTPAYIYTRNRCPSMPAAPSSPYSDPERYFGRPITPPTPAP